jgi:REP element-mobilizing transposase RayT
MDAPKRANAAPGNASLPTGGVSADVTPRPIRGMNPPANAFRHAGNPKAANQETGVPGNHPHFAQPVWHSRGYLPHFECEEITQHVTFHLADSLPKEILGGLEAELKSLPPEKRDPQRRKRIESWIGAGHGSCVLREPYIAAMVQESFLHFDAQRYRLLAWVVMPNHVHTLFQPIEGWTVEEIVASWKKHTARKIRDHARSGDKGPAAVIWHREYWDRYIRHEGHLAQAIEYIEANPVKAGLVAKPEHWQWSSAFPGNANLPIGGFPK